jgi:hypothetical protein
MKMKKITLEDFADNIKTSEMIKTVAEVILYDLNNLDLKRQKEYLEDILWELDRTSFKSYFADLGYLENYIDNFEDFEDFRRQAS